MKQYLYVFLLVLICHQTNSQRSNKYQICAKTGFYNDCQQLDRSNEIECEKNFNSIDCLININSGRSSFGSVTPEEALIASRFLENVVVLGEFRSTELLDEDSVFQTVVLVRSNYTDGFTSLRGARYCHPGFKYDEEVTDLLLKEFELELFSRNQLDICSASVDSNTLVEKHIKTVAEFFGPSCRPGSQTEDTELNKQIRERYSSLCELCGTDCSLYSNQAFISSLLCLTERSGDVAVTTLHSVQRFLNTSDNQNKLDDYRFLCKNGTLSPLNEPCIWSKQPWDIIIANKDIATDLAPQLQTWLTAYSTLPQATPLSSLSQTSEESLVSILMPEDRKFRKIQFLNNPVNLTDYLSGFRNVSTPENATQCGITMNWCTTSDLEQEKCKWFAQAGVNRGIQPVVQCVQAEDKLNCLSQIKNENVDVVDIDTNYGYLARRQGLSALAYAETITRNLTMILIVIKDNTTDITSIESLRNRAACIPEYVGIEWLAFANIVRRATSSSSCDLEQLTRDFVGESCMPGAHDGDHGITTSTLDSKLCALCRGIGLTAVSCNTDETNVFYGRQGALNCLKTVGDFAVIPKNTYDANPDSFRVLCSNGSLALYTGFDVDQDCALNIIINNEVVSGINNSKNSDLSVALFEFERWFGQDRRKPFELFNIFNRTSDLLFKDSTPGLDTPSSQNIYVQNYIREFATCAITAGSLMKVASFFLTFAAILMTMRLNH